MPEKLRVVQRGKRHRASRAFTSMLSTPSWMLASSMLACAPADTTVGKDAGAVDAEAGGRPVASCLNTPGGGGATCVETVSGAAVDLAGVGVGAQPVTLCGAGTCFGANTDAAGQFVIRVGTLLNASTYRVHLDGRPNFVDMFTRLDAASGPYFKVALSMRAARLPAAGPVLAAGAVESGGVALRILPTTEIEFGFANLSAPERGTELRVVAVPPDQLSELGQFDYLAGIAPFGTTLSIPAAVTIELAKPLPALQTVEFLVMQDDYSSPELGQMQVVATGRVSANGTQVSTDGGQGIRRLTWLAVRLVQGTNK